MDDRLVELARANYGIFTRVEARADGASDKMLRTRRGKGVIEEVLPDVFWHKAVPYTWHSRLKAATSWAAPAAASHRSAAALLGLDGFPQDLVEISTVRRVAAPTNEVIVHRAPELPGELVRERQGIPVTSVDKTLLDLGAVCHPRKVEQGLDDALRQRLTTLGRLKAHLDRYGRRGRNAVAVVRRLIEERMDSGYTESQFEKAVLRMVRRFALEMPIKQHPVEVSGHNYRIDFAYPDALVGVEAWSYSEHSDRDDWEYDSERHGHLTAAGWAMLYVTYRRLLANPASVAEQIRRVLASRRLF